MLLWRRREALSALLLDAPLLALMVRGWISYVVEHTGLRLRYRAKDAGTKVPQEVDELIPITTTRVTFGMRHWFLCRGCNRRCRIVYGGTRFRCRRCCGAKHESQYQHRCLTVADRRWALRRRLEERGSVPWPGGLDAGLGPKPKGMHWRTYQRLEAWDDAMEARWGLSSLAHLDGIPRWSQT
jgi:hypothetical protein